jgi:hypothetical protein
MKIYKLKFQTEQQAIDFFESVKEGLIEVAKADQLEIEYDIIHTNENIISEFEVFPKIVKHNFL